jgi:hypothetical protein
VLHLNLWRKKRSERNVFGCRDVFRSEFPSAGMTYTLYGWNYITYRWGLF